MKIYKFLSSHAPWGRGGRVRAWVLQQQISTAKFAIKFYDRRLDTNGTFANAPWDTNESRLEEASGNTHACGTKARQAAGTRREGTTSGMHYGSVRK